jgi:hypothetical protein
MASTQTIRKYLDGFARYIRDVIGFIEARRAVSTRETEMRDHLETASNLMDQLFRNKRNSLSHVETNTSIEKLENTLGNFEVFLEEDIQKQVDEVEQLADEIQRTLNQMQNVPEYHNKMIEGSQIITEELEEEIQRSETILSSSIKKLDRGAPPEEVADQVREFKVDTQQENFDKVERNIDRINKLLDRNSLKSIGGWKRMLSRKRSRKLHDTSDDEISSGVTSDLSADF